jgi:hypothetical protein
LALLWFLRRACRGDALCVAVLLMSAPIVYTYATGRALAVYEARQYAQCAAGYGAARAAARSWRHALNDHAETSYFGVAHIRAMRGFWLGVARAISQGAS